MEYITRQKIYDSRFWKEECFGLTAADVMERAAESLTCVGGTFSGMGKPTKFLSLTLKLLQLQPDKSVVQTFLEQNHFKYLRVLGAFYLRLTGRPQDIYEMLDPLYADYSKLKYRDVNEWKLIHVDEFIDDLLTKPICCGIAMPRLPVRETLQEAGYLEEGPRQTALHDALIEAGGIKDYLKKKVDQEVRKRVGRPTDAANNLSDHAANPSYTSAIALWERRYGKLKKDKKKDDSRDGGEASETTTNAVVGVGNGGGESNLEANSALIDEPNDRIASEAEDRKRKRKTVSDDASLTDKKKKKKKEKKSSKKYGTLFKPSATDRSNEKPARSRSKDEQLSEGESKVDKAVDQNSEEYWNNLRSSLGMNPLKKK